MANIISTLSLALKDFRLLPGYTSKATSLENIRLSSHLCRSESGFMDLNVPFISAPMQAVSSLELSIALAQLGGASVLPATADPADQAKLVNAVKHYKAGFQTDIVTLAPNTALTELVEIIADTGYTTFPVTDSGLFHGRLMGVITDKDFDSRDEGCDSDKKRTDIQSGVDIDDLAEANKIMIRHGRGFLPIVTRDNTLKSVVFKKDLDKHLRHPQATEDEYKRLRVGAAISTHPSDRDRIHLLAQESVDFIAIDASDGHSQFQQETIGHIKEQYSIPVIAGNVVTADGFAFLAQAGADAVKVGMGIGSGCTTQTVKATGRGQATALMEVCRARDAFYRDSGVYIPVVADGSINSSADIAIALSLGANSVMMGNFFARCTESPGQIVVREGRSYKEYWMEGSEKARNLRRYHQTHATFFAEGISGYVPHEGSIYDWVPQTVAKLKATLSTCGCGSIDDLHTGATLEQQSQTSLLQSGIRDMIEE